MIEPPAHLSDDARAAWRELTTGFAPEDLTGSAGIAIEAYAVQVARLRDAQRRIDTDGLVVRDDKGRPVEHPAVKIERETQAQIRAWAAAGVATTRRRRR